jgi:hypothetical protein
MVSCSAVSGVDKAGLGNKLVKHSDDIKSLLSRSILHIPTQSIRSLTMTISTSSSDPLIVIIGATGKQGGSVLKALTDSVKPYRMRIPTRDSSKSSAKSIAATGVEVIQLDLKPENYADIVKLFSGADIVYVSGDPQV